MSTKSEGKAASRRSFLKLASTTAPAAVAAAVMSGQEAEASTGALTEQAGSGMRDTAHTRAYYETARF